MATQTGTYDISSLLAVRFQSAVEFGLENIRRALENDIAAHNVIVNQMVSEMCEMTTDRLRVYGTSADGEMIEVDEYGRAPTQATETGATAGFPLRLFQFNVGWTEKWLQTNSPADMATRLLSAQQAHLRAIQREIKRASYLSANYTFQDHLVDKADIPVKRFVNADGARIPNGPNGELYDGATHTHYDGIAALTAAALKSSINDVIEHGHGSAVRVAINKADETTVRALSGFVAYPDPRIIYRASDTPGQTLDISRLDNRAIGIFEGAEVWVKPWAIANYAFVWDAGTPNKPLAFRQRTATGLQGLRIAAQNSAYPLYAQFLEAEFGIGVWTRTNGAVLYFANAAYTDPTIS
ncbi:MAG: hypothetical protein ACOYYS_19770 [Chloroflexota bacterium]